SLFAWTTSARTTSNDRSDLQVRAAEACADLDVQEFVTVGGSQEREQNPVGVMCPLVRSLLLAFTSLVFNYRHCTSDTRHFASGSCSFATAPRSNISVCSAE